MQHRPVLLVEALQALAIKEQGIYIDCTFGRGGHSQGILSILGKQGRLLAFDRDKAAIDSATALELQQDAQTIPVLRTKCTRIHRQYTLLEQALSHGLDGRRQ